MAWLAALLPGATATVGTAGSIGAASSAAGLAAAATAPTIGTVSTGISAATALQAAGLATTLLSTGVAARNSSAMGKAQARAYNAEAKAEKVRGQYAAVEERRLARYAQSRALAVAGASGAGASDPTVMNTIGDLEAEGEYRALTSLFNGEQRARSQTMQANIARSEGKAGSVMSLMRGGATLLNNGMVTDWLEKYG
jgi:hypothetical protein